MESEKGKLVWKRTLAVKNAAKAVLKAVRSVHVACLCRFICGVSVIMLSFARCPLQ
jgi:hypothetical protein